MQTSITSPRRKDGLVDTVIAGVAELTDQLEYGAVINDIVCGAGVAATLVSKAFPNSQVVGMDPSPAAIATACAQPRTVNVDIQLAGFEDMAHLEVPEIVITVDVLHDLRSADMAADSVCRALKDDGLWLIQDMVCWPTFEENVGNIPWAPLYYGMLLMYCLGASASTPRAEGYGALGLYPDRVIEVLTRSGFNSCSAFRVEEYGNSQWHLARKKGEA